MIRTLLTLAAGIGVGVAVTFAADHDHHKALKVTQLSQRDIIEKLDGKETKVTVVEVTLNTGQGGEPHRTALGWAPLVALSSTQATGCSSTSSSSPSRSATAVDRARWWPSTT